MPGYQRFVTYLFLYEEEKKRENCGFAKVEIRQDQCRIQLQVKGIRQKSVDVYLLNQNVKEPEGVLLGAMQVRNGVAEQTFFCNSNHVGESGYAIGQMRGIYIPLESAEFVASQWDDEMTVWSQFRAWSSTTGEPDIVEAGMLKLDKNDANDKNQSDLETVAKTTEKDSDAVNGLNTGEKNGEMYQERQTSKTAKREIHSNVGITKNETHPNVEMAKNEMHPKVERAEMEINDNGSELHVTQTASAMTYPLQMGWVQQWERFTAAHPLICPFDEDDRVYAVKLKLQDFTILPKRYQYLANNNFLLHGYFNYEMIIFGYMEEEKRRWFLGVPGVFSNQEQLLAGIFGFPEFRTKQVTRQKTGEYGYWCRYLD